MQWQTTTETLGAGNNHQSVAGGIGSGRDSGRGSGNCCSLAAMAGRGSSTAEVTTMRAAATATTMVVTLYPLFPLAMVRDDEREGRLLTKGGDVDLFMFVIHKHKISESRSSMLTDPPRLNLSDAQTLTTPFH
jgi:hypothetical protein